MGTIDIQKLLQEVSPGEPSGKNLEYDAEYGQMTRLAQGKPEQQVGTNVIPAEEPNWREVKGKAVQLLGRSKDLRLGVFLTRALLRTDGFVGLGDGLELLRGLLERYWDTVYPQLDPDDGNDPTFRVNTLAGLCHADGMLKGLREVPLASSRAHGRVSLRDVLIATGKLPPAPAGSPASPDGASIDAIFSNADLDALRATADAVGKSVEHVQAIESILMEKVGSKQAADFGELSGVLKGAHKVLAERLSRRGVAVATTGGEPMAEPGASAPAAVPAVPGEIASRDDAMRMIDKVCDYFVRHEPSSPVPMLLRRAKRLVSKNFMDIVRDLAPDGVPQVEKIRGEGNDA
jgi:type VI secretion system protein ImpA